MLIELLAIATLQEALRPVSAGELTDLLDGVRLQHGEIEWGPYYFRGGRHVIPGRVVRQGHWRAESGRLCDWSWPDRRDEQCIIVLTDGRGLFYTAKDDAELLAGEVHQARFVPILTR